MIIDGLDRVDVTKDLNGARINYHAGFSKKILSIEHYAVERDLPEPLYRVNVETQLRNNSLDPHLLIDWDISERTSVMIAIHPSNEELRPGRCQVERENWLRKLALGNKGLEDRGGLKIREGLECHTQNAIGGEIAGIHVSTRGRAKCLPSSLMTGIVSYPLMRPNNGY
jgi:hypothetical protein